MFPKLTFDGNACTVSTIELNVNESCAVSAPVFKTWYPHKYGSPIDVGEIHPFEKLIP